MPRIRLVMHKNEEALEGAGYVLSHTLLMAFHSGYKQFDNDNVEQHRANRENRSWRVLLSLSSESVHFHLESTTCMFGCNMCDLGVCRDLLGATGEDRT